MSQPMLKSPVLFIPDKTAHSTKLDCALKTLKLIHKNTRLHITHVISRQCNEICGGNSEVSLGASALRPCADFRDLQASTSLLSIPNMKNRRSTNFILPRRKRIQNYFSGHFVHKYRCKMNENEGTLRKWRKKKIQKGKIAENGSSAFAQDTSRGSVWFWRLWWKEILARLVIECMRKDQTLSLFKIRIGSKMPGTRKNWIPVRYIHAFTRYEYNTIIIRWCRHR